MSFDEQNVETPCYITDERLLIQNLEILKDVSEKSGAKILLAQKAFSMFSVYPLIKKYLSGTTASGLYEAKLGFEEMGGETHIFSPAYKATEFDKIIKICDHIIFNSFSQWEKFKSKALKSSKSFGIRINPELSTQEHGIYDPCGKYSRLGVTISQFKNHSLEGIEGLHFHTLCEQNSDDFVKTLNAFEDKFHDYISQMKWINFGGGHHITRKDYDINLLISTIRKFKEKYNVEVYLEPGEAIALNAGFLVSEVVDIVHNDIDIAIMDVSAACHMPDVIEMPYRPYIEGSDMPNIKPFTYRLGGPTCLAGDIIGDYSFDKPLKIGDRLTFCDMAIYSMVKNNTFNGMKLPSIYLNDINNNIRLIKEFGYNDFKKRLS